MQLLRLLLAGCWARSGQQLLTAGSLRNRGGKLAIATDTSARASAPVCPSL